MPDTSSPIPIDQAPVPDGDPVTPVTMAEVIARIAADPKLTPTQRRDWTSACHQLCDRWLHMPPETVPADLRRLDRRIADLHPRHLGVGGQAIAPTTFATLKGAIRKAVGRYGGGRPRSRTPLPALGALPPAWSTLWDRLPAVGGGDGASYVRVDLSRLIRHLVTAGADPATVTPADLEAAITTATDDPLTSPERRQQRIRTARAAWAWAMAHVPGWPQVAWSAPPADPAWAPPLTAFAASFVADVEEYVRCRGVRSETGVPEHAGPRTRLLARRAARQQGAVERGRQRRPLSDATLVSHVLTLRRAAGALVRSGVPIEEITGIGTVATIDAAVLIVEETIGASTPDTDTFATLLRTLRSAAVRWRHDLTQDEVDDFAAEIATYQVNGDGMLPSIERKLLSVTPETLHRLFTWPATVFAEVQRVSRGGRRRVDRDLARRAAAALAVDIEMTVCPRRSTLVRTHLDRSIVRHGDRTATLHYQPHETKTKRGLAADLDRDQTRRLRLYEQCCQPVLRQSGSNRWFFPGIDGDAPMHPAAMARMICRMIFRELGIRLHVHLFRHLLATLLLAEDPHGNMHLVHALLGHTPDSTSTQKYATFHTKWASAAVRKALGEQLLAGLHRTRPRVIATEEGR